MTMQEAQRQLQEAQWNVHLAFVEKARSMGFRGGEKPEHGRAIFIVRHDDTFGFTPHIDTKHTNFNAYDIDYWVYPEELSRERYNYIRNRIMNPDLCYLKAWEGDPEYEKYRYNPKTWGE